MRFTKASQGRAAIALFALARSASASEDAEADLLRPGGVAGTQLAVVDSATVVLVPVIGATLGIGHHFELSVAAILGPTRAFRPGVTVFLAASELKPMVFLGLPIFFVNDGPSPALEPAAGLHWDFHPHVGCFAQAGAVVPLESHYDTVLLVTTGVRARI